LYEHKSHRRGADVLVRRERRRARRGPRRGEGRHEGGPTAKTSMRTRSHPDRVLVPPPTRARHARSARAMLGAGFACPHDGAESVRDATIRWKIQPAVNWLTHESLSLRESSLSLRISLCLRPLSLPRRARESLFVS
jgi:hypothetical protein